MYNYLLCDGIIIVSDRKSVSAESYNFSLEPIRFGMGPTNFIFFVFYYMNNVIMVTNCDSYKIYKSIFLKIDSVKRHLISI